MKYIIVGGVAGGATAAARIRRNDENAQIVLFEKGSYISYANCGLPYYLGGIIPELNQLILQTPESFGQRYYIDVFTQTEVIAIDPVAHTVTVRHKDKERTESYDKLLLSPGATPVRPPLPGVSLPGIFTLRNVADIKAINSFVSQTPLCHAVVVGGGFIGLEMAENLCIQGIHVTLVEAANHVMTPLDTEMASQVQSYLVDRGIHVVTGQAVTSFTARPGESAAFQGEASQDSASQGAGSQSGSQSAASQGEACQSSASQGAASQGEACQSSASQGAVSQGEAFQSSASQGAASQGEACQEGASQGAGSQSGSQSAASQGEASQDGASPQQVGSVCDSTGGVCDSTGSVGESTGSVGDQMTGVLAGVQLADGRILPADIVILSIGVRPETTLARAAGLELGSTGGIRVDAQLRTSAPDIYAVGDAIEFPHPITGKPWLNFLAGPANRQARLVADQMTGAGDQMTDVGNQLTDVGDQMTGAGNQLTDVGDQMTDAPHRATSAPNTPYEGSLGTAVAKIFSMTLATTGLAAHTLEKEGLDYLSSITHSPAHAGYYPGAKPMSIKLTFHPTSGRLYGAQIVGFDGVDKRIDVIAQVIKHGGTVTDLTQVEHAYAPPFSSAKDPVAVAGYVAENILRGKVRTITWEQMRAAAAGAAVAAAGAAGEAVEAAGAAAGAAAETSEADAIASVGAAGAAAGAAVETSEADAIASVGAAGAAAGAAAEASEADAIASAGAAGAAAGAAAEASSSAAASGASAAATTSGASAATTSGTSSPATIPLLLDVRTPKEFEEGAIPGALNLPLDELRERLDELQEHLGTLQERLYEPSQHLVGAQEFPSNTQSRLDNTPTGRPIYVYCAIGLRGYLASRILLQNGFTNVFNLSGGYKTYKSVCP